MENNQNHSLKLYYSYFKPFIVKEKYFTYNECLRNYI